MSARFQLGEGSKHTWDQQWMKKDWTDWHVSIDVASVLTEEEGWTYFSSKIKENRHFYFEKRLTVTQTQISLLSIPYINKNKVNKIVEQFSVLLYFCFYYFFILLKQSWQFDVITINLIIIILSLKKFTIYYQRNNNSKYLMGSC